MQATTLKLWGGRFNKSTNELVDEYNASIHFDHILAKHDIIGSIAHVKMLAKCELISKDECKLISNGLLDIKEQISNKEVKFNVADEDIHLNIERILHEKIGPVAGKLHTGRSRNDQVALDLHLYLRENVLIIIKQLHELLVVIHSISKNNIDTIIPGYTHLQRAEPVRFAHHMLAYFNMFSRDMERLTNSFTRINVCPLGAGALAGSGVAIDSEYTANLLGFSDTYANSLDAVSDRDFVVEFLANASLTMMHISKLSEELILWSSTEFSFIQLDDAFCTGSSMMPQKKNPDVCELSRGKTGRVYGALMGILTVLKGLPLAYNKDMQEDKEGVFDSVKTLSQTLSVYTPMLESMQINKEIMLSATKNDFANATNLANYLTRKNIPFREAHEITGKIVLHCLEQNKLLIELDITDYQKFSPLITNDVFKVLDVEAVIEAHSVKGGTSKKSVEVQLQEGAQKLLQYSKWISDHDDFLRDLKC
ncbi:MAG: argininosuccinate lyase [Legionellaceae bacterium]|nr:argininosuccinate lyase [Legionellaceae bacterium]